MVKAAGPASLPTDAIHPTSRAAWRRWLTTNHARSTGVWVVSWKKATHRARVEYDDAVVEALCFGWIDSRPRALDAQRSMLWYAPRKPRSGWSKLNKERVARAIAEGRMTPAGLAKIAAAKKDGSWSSLDAVETLTVPRDLAAAFRAQPPAAARFAAFPRSVKPGILEWIGNAKRPETRARRVDETARLAARNSRANQWRR